MFSYVLNPMESGPCIGGLNEIGRGIHFNVVRSCVKSTPVWVDFIRPIYTAGCRDQRYYTDWVAEAERTWISLEPGRPINADNRDAVYFSGWKGEVVLHES